MTNAVLTSVANGVATLTLNKPEKLNAWDTPMRGEVAAHLRAWNKDHAVKAIIMTGAGDRAFCAGQDLDETEKLQGGKAGAGWFAAWRDFYNAIRELDKPLIAALNGVAAGSAFQAALLCDIRIGHAGSRMGQPEINSGIPSITGPMLMLPRVGLSRTIELVLTGRMMEAQESFAIGLIQHLVASPAEVMPKALAVASELAAKPPIAMRLNKRRLRQVTEEAFEEAFRSGGAYQAEAFASGEPQAAMRAFFEERRRRRAARQKA
jgi:enoyl-CoA hydratase/carnithine racemase